MENSNKSHNDLEFNSKWEDAYFKQFHSAVIGEMFRGIVHNLNGVNQAFSLQSALLKSMFDKSFDIFEKINKSEGEDTQTYLKELFDLIEKRSFIAAQMEEKLEQNLRIMKRVLPLSNMYELSSDTEISINRIINYELDILNAISFFKHSVVKDIQLEHNLPCVKHSFEDVHNIIYVIIINAIEALQEYQHGTPKFSIKTSADNQKLLIEISNSGDSRDVDFDRMCEPFYSGKEGHLGIGLYLAAKSIQKLKGQIFFNSNENITTFTIKLPY